MDIDDSWEFDEFGEVIRRLKNPSYENNFMVSDKGEWEEFGTYKVNLKFPDVKFGFWLDYLEDMRRIATPYNRADKS